MALESSILGRSVWQRVGCRSGKRTNEAANDSLDVFSAPIEPDEFISSDVPMIEREMEV